MKKVLFVCVTMLLICISGKATERRLLLIPYPQQVSIKQGNYNLTNNVKIGADPLLTQELKKLQEALTGDFGLKSQIVKPSKADISLCYDASFMPEEKEAYQLEVTNMKIIIRAKTATGIFYGIQSLRQLIKSKAGKWIIPKLTITDYPALSWRSFMLDEGRYFKGEKVVKQILDEMALLKMNVFQWHLTDDQGWRIEIKKYPRLTEIGAFRDSTQMEWYESHRYDGKPHGGFYTQAQIRDIIKYAAERHITIIPEIEMPGHSAAAIAAYPWLSATGKEIKVPCYFGVQYDVFNVADPKVLNFLDNVIDEVTTLFPSGILHIGGDEVRYDQWNASPSVQKFIHEKGLSSASDIQVWFTNRMSKVITQKGWRMMGWNDITGEKLHHFQSGDKKGTERLAPGTIVQFWKGDSDMMQRAAEQGQHIVNSYNNFTYLNYSYEYDSLQATYEFKPIPLRRAYEFKPIPENFPAHLIPQILGAGCQMWGEWIPTVESMNYHIYPRIGAYAEVFWTLPIQKDYARFRKSLEYFLTRWKNQGIIYGPTEKNSQICSAQQVNIEFENPDEFNASYQYVTGISGKALDIGSNAAYRHGIELTQLNNLANDSFSFHIWTKSTSKYPGTKALLSNKKSDSNKDKGLLLTTQKNGSYMISVSNGNGVQYDYRPTVERQPLNDGNWHQIGISFDATRQELRLYYDGRNVAIYYTEAIDNLNSGFPFYLGSIDGSEWQAFNGYLDHLSFCNETKSVDWFAKDFKMLTNRDNTPELPITSKQLNIMGFNIYHGGHELGEEIGVNRIIDIIRNSGAEIAALIETYGSGEKIADALGYYFYSRSNNLSIISRYPIEETYDIFHPFNCGGALIRISQSQKIRYVNLWLNYLPLTNEQIQNQLPSKEIEASEWKTRATEVQQILKEMSPLYANEDIPLIVSGDFNSGSHLDWTKKASHLYEGYTVEWPTSQLMTKAGFTDSYRYLYPNPVTHPCMTWSPMAKNELQYRIDFIYYKGKGILPKDSYMIDKHPIRFPSDHAAMVTLFSL